MTWRVQAGHGVTEMFHVELGPDDRVVKIDRSFVRDIATDADDRAIVKGVIGLASTLGMDVTAEGVEDEGQRSFLCQEGCTYLQGYGIARPMPAEDMARWMRERVVAPA